MGLVVFLIVIAYHTNTASRMGEQVRQHANRQQFAAADSAGIANGLQDLVGGLAPAHLKGPIPAKIQSQEYSVPLLLTSAAVTLVIRLFEDPIYRNARSSCHAMILMVFFIL